MAPKRFVLLDRDGTLIVEKHYLSDPDALELLPGTAPALRRLRELGLGLAVVTNQSGLARGFFDTARLAAIHARLAEALADEGVTLDGIYSCPHHPDEGCGCRKPRPGLVEQAAAELGFEAERCFVVGDAASDVGLGRAVGATTLLVRTGYGAEVAARGDAGPDFVVADLPEAAGVIAGLLSPRP